MSGRELYKIMIKNDLDFVIDKIIEKNNDLTIKELKIEELLKEIERLNNIINELEKILTEEYDYCDKHIDPAFGTGMGVAKRTLDKLKELKDSD